MNPSINVGSVVEDPNLKSFVSLPPASIQAELPPVPLDVVGTIFRGPKGDKGDKGNAQFSIDPAVVTRKFALTVGTGAATSIAVNHGLNTLDVQVQVVRVSTGETVECAVVRTSTAIVTLGFAVAPATDSIRVLVQG